MSKDIAIFFWFIVLFLALTIVKIVFFEEHIAKPIAVEEKEEDNLDEETKKDDGKAKAIMKNMYKNFEKTLENDVNEASKVFNESVKSIK